MPSLSASERIGTIVANRYEIRRLVGEGGFSSVFEAVHSVTGREVALKLLHPHLVTTEQITERFLNEARAMARIRHDGIVQVLDAGADPDGTVYIALELLNGESLESTLTRVTRLTWGEATSIGVDVLSALAEAHRNKIIHRDIKPGNIFIVRKSDGSSQAKLLDFGIAHMAQAKGKLTLQGMILGTPEYMSPEQARSGAVGPESDIWSVGIVLYECLVGSTPFYADSTTEILLNVQTTDAPPVTRRAPDVPEPLAAVIARSLARDLTERYRSADEMREALQRAVVNIDANRASFNPRQSGEMAAPTRPSSPTKRSSNNPLRANTGPAPKREPPLTEDGRASAPEFSRRSPLPQPAVRENGAPITMVHTPGEGLVVDTGERPAASSVHITRSSGERERPSSPAIGTPPGGQDPTSSPDLKRPSTDGSRSSPDLKRPSLEGVRPPRAPTLSAVGRRGTNPTPTDHEFDEPRTGSFRTTQPLIRSNFQPPPEVEARPRWALLVGAGLVLTGVGLVIAMTSRPHDDVVHARDGGAHEPREAADVVVAPTPAPVEVVRWTVTRSFEPPAAFLSTDNRAEFARHAACSGLPGTSPAATTQRIVVSCLHSVEGVATLFLNPLNEGPTLGTFQGQMACAGHDVGVVPDVTDDGTDDVVAVNDTHDGLLVIDARSQRVVRSVTVPGARGFAAGGGFMIRNATQDVIVPVYTETTAGGRASAAVVGVNLRSQEVAWRIRGVEPLARVGQPLELGLAIGTDANQDGVADVAVGLAPALGEDTSDAGARRCVQLYSGVTGQPLWATPTCRIVGLGAQSVSVGPDVNGDGRGDVLVGSDHAGAAPVTLLSGANGQPLRTFTARDEAARAGFGWPVALSGDLDGDGVADAIVGTVGRGTMVTVLSAGTGERIDALTLGGVGSGNLRVFAVEPTTPTEPWSMVVADPATGVKVYRRRVDNGGS